MLKHGSQNSVNPSRIVLMGAEGFVGGTIVEVLSKNNIHVEPLDKKDIDLLSDNGASSLAERLKPDDAFVAVSAIAPCKNLEMLKDNIIMAKVMCDALQKQPVCHVVNISSDAVYADDATFITEELATSPSGLHGVMHLSREIMFRSTVKSPLAILRPSIMYGWRDPHNGYGPNRFARQAHSGEDIVLFGEGEEKRDHLAVEDLAAIVYKTLVHRSAGILNVATGNSISFRDVAEMVVKITNSRAAIKGTPRQNPVTHRHFDIVNSLKAFPTFHYTALDEGLSRICNRMIEVR